MQKLFHSPKFGFFAEIGLWSMAIVIVSFIPLTAFRLQFLGVVAYIIALILGFRRFTFEEMGFRHNFKITLFPWIVTSVFMIIAVIIIKYFYPSGIFVGFRQSFKELLGFIPSFSHLRSEIDYCNSLKSIPLFYIF